jgi:hypothetical protein
VGEREPVARERGGGDRGGSDGEIARRRRRVADLDRPLADDDSRWPLKARPPRMTGAQVTSPASTGLPLASEKSVTPCPFE